MIDKLRQLAPLLTGKDRKIADFILQDTEEMLSMSINEVAEKVGVSASTVSRFAASVFELSFPQLKLALARSTAKAGKEIRDTDMSIDDSLSRLESKLTLNITKLFEETLSINPSGKIESAAKMILDADIIYIWGIGASGFAAQDLSQKLIKLQKRAIYNMDASLAIMNSSLCTPGDLGIAISYSGISKEVLIPSRKAKELGCPVISISGGNRNKLACLADINLSVPSREAKIIRTTAIYSRYAQFLLIDLLYLAMVKLLGASVDVMMEKYSDLLIELKN